MCHSDVSKREQRSQCVIPSPDTVGTWESQCKVKRCTFSLGLPRGFAPRNDTGPLSATIRLRRMALPLERRALSSPHVPYVSFRGLGAPAEKPICHSESRYRRDVGISEQRKALSIQYE